MKFMRKAILASCLSLMCSSALSAEDVAASVSAPSLNEVLRRTRESVKKFWGDLKSVACEERVAQEKLGKQGKIEYMQKSTFDYLVLLSSGQDNLSVEESRFQQGKTGKSKNIPLMLSSGVPTLLLVFHPYYEGDFVYRLDDYEPLDGDRLLRIHFQHVPGTRSTTALRLRGKDYPLDIQGTAWIDPATGTIQRVQAVLPGPMDDLNLKSLEIEVRYSPHDFSSDQGRYWLPSVATVNLQTERQHWRNVHQYSNYRRFTVNTEDKVSR